MAQDTRKRIIIIAAAALIVLLASAGAVALMGGLSSDEKDPYKQKGTSTTQDKETNTAPPLSESQKKSPETEPSDQAASLDPESIATIDIPPMGITASYVKGVGSVEYEVLRTPRGSQYVEFRSPDLVGTKCTGDQGTFASILADPKSDEGVTLAKSTIVDGVTYGLSLVTNTCTNDADKLKDYQESFSDAFSLLKKME